MTSRRIRLRTARCIRRGIDRLAGNPVPLGRPCARSIVRQRSEQKGRNRFDSCHTTALPQAGHLTCRIDDVIAKSAAADRSD